MHKLNYALYRGHIYKKPSESKFAYVYTSTVESFLNTLLANQKIAEVLINQLQQVSVILSNRECSIIKQIQIDHNLIEVYQLEPFLTLKRKDSFVIPLMKVTLGKLLLGHLYITHTRKGSYHTQRDLLTVLKTTLAEELMNVKIFYESTINSCSMGNSLRKPRNYA